MVSVNCFDIELKFCWLFVLRQQEWGIGQLLVATAKVVISFTSCGCRLPGTWRELTESSFLKL